MSRGYIRTSLSVAYTFLTPIPVMACPFHVLIWLSVVCYDHVLAAFLVSGIWKMEYRKIEGYTRVVTKDSDFMAQ